MDATAIEERAVLAAQREVLRILGEAGTSEKLYYNTQEAAQLLGVSCSTILDARKSGRLEGFKRGGRVYYTRAGLLEWFERSESNSRDHGMASVRKEKDRGREGYRLQVYLPTGRRASAWLGKISKQQADEICVRIQKLINAVRIGSDPPTEMLKWAARCGQRMQERLIDWKLLRPEQLPAKPQTLGEFTTAWRKTQEHRKPGTLRNYDHAIETLKERFSESRGIDRINESDAKAWAQWMTEERGLAPSTAGKLVKIARKMFKAAMVDRQITSNPFVAAPASTKVKPNRKVFIPRETITRVIEQTACPEWRLIIALARFGGLRVPSEVLGLKWNDINWERQRFLVHSPKTEHHEGGESRVVPLFAELRPFLDAAYEAAPDGSVYVITRYRDQTSNLGTQLTRLIKRSGEKPWPKLFVNLRASCRTELEAIHPSHVVDAWLGHSYQVAKDHYLMPREDDFIRASGGVVGGVVDSNPSETTGGKTPENTTN